MSASRCEKCGGELQHAEDKGMLERYECIKCGHSHWVTFTPPVAAELGKTSWKVIVRWAGEAPTRKELAALRSISSRFSTMKARDVLELARKERVLEVGDYPREEADELIRKGREMGLNVQVLPSE